MLSAEPLMDARGYPNLFATGETAGRRGAGRPPASARSVHGAGRRGSMSTWAPAPACSSMAARWASRRSARAAFMHRRVGREQSRAAHQPITGSIPPTSPMALSPAGISTQLLPARRPRPSAARNRTRSAGGSRRRGSTAGALRGTWTRSPRWALQASYAGTRRAGIAPSRAG